mgnify:CR=1 FL=1
MIVTIEGANRRTGALKEVDDRNRFFERIIKVDGVTIGVVNPIFRKTNRAVIFSIGPEDRRESVNVTRESFSFFFNRDHVYTLNYSNVMSRLIL